MVAAGLARANFAKMVIVVVEAMEAGHRWFQVPEREAKPRQRESAEARG
jgi:hypothetical protein